MGWIDDELSRRSTERENSFRKRNTTKLATYAALGAYGALLSGAVLKDVPAPDTAMIGAVKPEDLGAVLGAIATTLIAVLAACWMHHARHAERISDFLFELERAARLGESNVSPYCYEEYMHDHWYRGWSWCVSAFMAFFGVCAITLMVTKEAPASCFEYWQIGSIILALLCFLVGLPDPWRRKRGRARAAEILEA
jgi:hypothetical protein